MLAEANDVLREAQDAGKPFSLFFVDTLQAYFTGEDSNSNTQAVQFVRALRPLTELPGRPAGIICAHPTKDAGEDRLVPYGAGGIINEVDGNLTGVRAGGRFTLHWQRKFRGIDFKPIEYVSELVWRPEIIDGRGRQIPLPVLRVAGEHEIKARSETRKKP
jgi:hypothetical protein